MIKSQDAAMFDSLTLAMFEKSAPPNQLMRDVDDTIDGKTHLGEFKGRFILKKGEESVSPLYSIYKKYNPEMMEEDFKVSSGLNIAFIFMYRDRYFAILHGHGRHLINKNLLEPHFGIKVVLGLADPNRLKFIKCRTAYGKKRNLTENFLDVGSINQFNFDYQIDFMSGVKAEAIGGLGALKLEGSDTLKISNRVPVGRLAEYLELIYNTFCMGSYKEHFDWLDTYQLASEDERKILDMELVDKLNQHRSEITDHEEVYIVAPDETSCDRFSFFRFIKNRKYVGREVYTVKFTDFFEHIKNEVTIDLLKNIKIKGLSEEGQHEVGVWPFYDFISFYYSHDDKKYVLINGQWLSVKTDYIKGVDEYFEKKVTKKYFGLFDLSECPYNREEKYNEYCAKKSDGRLTLLDKKLVTRALPGRSSIEICDLLGNKNTYIHVKNGSRSSTLSHLWNQGQTSIEVLIDSRKARKEIFKKLKKPEDLKRLPLDPPKPVDCHIVFAIIQTGHPMEFKIPFLAKAALKRAFLDLEKKGFKVTLTKIPKGVRGKPFKQPCDGPIKNVREIVFR